MWCGIDQLLSAPEFSALRKRLRTQRVGVLSHAAAIDQRGRTLLNVLEELGIYPRLIFTPEHGFEPIGQAEEPVSKEDAEAGQTSAAPVLSLYGKTEPELAPKPEHLAELDVLLVDLVDVGSRYYTYVWTALIAVRAAARAGVASVILDRPNPISGDPESLEGKPQDLDFLSFVGLEPLPIRHALTIGEILVRCLAAEGVVLGESGALSVVPVRGWERCQTASAWCRPFIWPSPNMPTLETALVYPGGCLLEGTNLSEGRGTTAPFQCVGAPFLDGARLAQALVESGAPGVLVRPISFRPWFHKFAGEIVHGVMLHVTQPKLFRPVSTYLRLISLAHAQAPDKFIFRHDSYEFDSRHPAFDLLSGSAEARRAIEQGEPPAAVAELIAPVPREWQDQVRAAEALLEHARA